MIAAPNSYFLEQESSPAPRPVFIITLGTNYIVPQADILNPGVVRMARPSDFTDLSSGDYTCNLINNDGKYSPDKSTFIFAGQFWYRQPISVAIGYERPGFDIIDSVVIYQGLITEWIIVENKDPSHDAPYEGVQIQINAKDFMSLLLEHQIGMPLDDGTPQPVPYGQVFKDMEPLADQTPWTHDLYYGFESGNWGGLPTQFTGSGAGSVINTDSAFGSYSAYFSCNDAPSSAMVCLPISVGSAMQAQIGMWIKIVNLPSPGSMNFNGDLIMMQLTTGAGAVIQQLGVWNDGQVYLWDANTSSWFATDWNVYETEDLWIPLTIRFWGGYTGQFCNTMVYVNRQRVISQTFNDLSNGIVNAWFGIAANFDNLGWELYVDEIFFDYSTGSVLIDPYYLPAAPYQSIDSIYNNGSILPKQQTYLPGSHPKTFVNRGNYKNEIDYVGNPTFIGGYDSYPTYGIIDNVSFQSGQNLSNPMAKMTHDALSHPVDIIEDLLTLAGLDSYINVANFATAKAAMPDDVIGCWFESTTCAAAISEVVSRCLYDLVFQNGYFCLFPYLGTPKNSYEMTLNKSNCYSMTLDYDQSNIKTGTTCKWGWYSNSNRLFYRHDNTTLKSALGDQSRLTDWSYGSSVFTADWVTAKAKTDLLLNRMQGAIDRITLVGDLSSGRLELGDGILVDNSELFDTETIFEIGEMNIDMSQHTVEIVANRYEGEPLPS